MILATAPLGVADAAGDVYGSWTVAAGGIGWTGSLGVGAVGFPTAGLDTDSTTPSTPTAAFLSAATPFGERFGSSQGASYLSAAAASGGRPSTTTITFTGPTPSGTWGFALGDIDADQVQVSAVGPGGPLTVAELGFQGSFSYCTASTPRPSSCGGVEGTDVPVWDPTAAVLRGNGTDTAGAAGWFVPTRPLTALTLQFSVITGIPSFQLWVAAETADLTGNVSTTCGDPVPDGSTVRLVDGAGSVVASAPVAASGAYVFAGLAAAPYTVDVVTSAGTAIDGAASLPVDLSIGDIGDAAILVGCAPQPPPPLPPTTTTVVEPVPTLRPEPPRYTG